MSTDSTQEHLTRRRSTDRSAGPQGPAVAPESAVPTGPQEPGGEGYWYDDDVSVVGWDDEEFAQFIGPGLTTVAWEKNLQGRRAMQELVAAIHGEGRPTFPDVPIGRLVIRGSTGPAPSRVE